MRKPFDSISLMTLFELDENHLKQREKVGSYIHSFGSLIADRMYSHYLLKDPTFRNILSLSDTPRLVRMFGEYFSSLFIHPFDERLIERTRQIAEIHMAIGLEAIQVSRGFDILNEIIIDLAGINVNVREDLAIILKMIRISESVMNQSYVDRYFKHQEELKRENEVLTLFDTLYAALTIHKQNQQKLIRFWDKGAIENETFHTEDSCPFSRTLDVLGDKSELLLGFGIDISQARSLHHAYHENVEMLLQLPRAEGKTVYERIIEISQALYGIIDKPLSDISATTYMGVHSGIEFLHACAHSIYESGSSYNPDELINGVREKLYEQLHQTLGWCIEGLYVGEGHIDGGEEYDVVGKIVLNEHRMNVGVALKDIPNKHYMTEIIRILLEILRQNFQNREREHALIRLVDDAERSSRAKDMFLANMSHELRTPLNAIIGFSQILMMNKSIPENLRAYIQKITISGNNLLSLVNTILDFAKLEAGKLNFKPEITVVAGIFHEVLSIVEPLAQKKAITFHHPELISLGLYLDRSLIVQVLLNLLSNAVKFTQEGGEITLGLEYDLVERVYRFSITDTGIGIEAKDIATLFDPFTQVENPFQKSSKGTGLGLAISKRIIEDLHKGKLWVESQIGVGSTFYFTIPVSDSQTTMTSYPNLDSGLPSILIVEDAHEYQQILVERLKNDFNIMVTNSVNLAKELLEKERFDFIILDFFLVDGISSEVLQFMEANAIRTPTIIISAEDDNKLISHFPDAQNVEGIFNKVNINEICDFLTFQTKKRGSL
ncbi:MAG: ATP-binding protein [Sulfuricurvum sp.]|uniref:ATP-binding protein n=1 Tax=Sulfuricurvum sp. TaxID=2025608 RepID=UPI00261AE042|nr:ATP-binding protein [Sulfuricurvum sp.]MDD2828378.1 ATP-binding protein [Sulfuricurvum sp.]MDD4949383.1 ATP-binding protein [Sulfuricurvum sp.]